MFRCWTRLRAQGGWSRCEPLPAHLSDLLYLCPSLPDERATLAGRDNQPQGNWWLGADGAVGHQRRQILKGEKWKQRGGGDKNTLKTEKGGVKEDKSRQRGQRADWRREKPTEPAALSN